MCGRFTLKTPSSEIAQLLALRSPVQLALRYNIAPTQSIAVVRALPGDGRRLSMMAWGLVPSWAKSASDAARLINARAETVATKPAFREAFDQRRCLIPADGFYEWQRRGRAKVPFHIRLKTGGLFAMAGLWDHWPGEQGNNGQGEMESCTIITTGSNELVRPLHDRMPVILPVEAYDQWLDPNLHDRDLLEKLLKPYPAGEMVASAVSSKVNAASFEGIECLEPREPETMASQKTLDFG